MPYLAPITPLGVAASRQKKSRSCTASETPYLAGRPRPAGSSSHSRGRPAMPVSSSACVNRVLPTRWLNQMR